MEGTGSYGAELARQLRRSGSSRSRVRHSCNARWSRRLWLAKNAEIPILSLAPWTGWTLPGHVAKLITGRHSPRTSLGRRRW